MVRARFTTFHSRFILPSSLPRTLASFRNGGKAILVSGEEEENNHGFVGSKFRDTIVGQITTGALALAVIPIVLVGVVTVVSLFALAGRASDTREDLAASTIGPSRAEEARLVLTRLDDYIEERVNDMVDWSRASIVVQMAGADRVDVDRMNSKSIEALENEFGGSYQLDSTGSAARYLTEQIADQPYFVEAFFTDANGYNVAATNQTSDFVQSDEEWWQQAWQNGLYIGQFEYDESANAFSFDMAARIMGPGDQPVGVLKTVVDISTLQSFANEFASGGETNVEVRVLTTDGVLLAETATAHDERRIGQQVNYVGEQATTLVHALESAAGHMTEGDLGDDVAAVAMGDHPEGYLLHDESVAGFSASSPTRFIRRLGTEVDAQQIVAIVEQPKEAALAPLTGVSSLQQDLSRSSKAVAGVVVVLIIVTVLVAFVVSGILARNIVKPLEQLRSQARQIANHHLPGLVESLRSPDAGEELPELPTISVEAQDEVLELADAFNSVQAAAAQLAASQAVGRNRDMAALLLSLGRRNQQLVGRQLQFIDQLERTEQNADTLQNLFQLDQMATRMRRNAESLLVLAGEEGRGRRGAPVTVENMVREAISAVEDFTRVDLVDAEPVSLKPTAAADISHLLAELIENAASFSPPDTRVEVVGASGHDGSYTVSIIDRGIGMSPADMEAANNLIRDPRFTEQASASQLGLVVVGRIASRHNIDARLVESATSGLTAKITIPAELVVGARITSDDEPIIDLTDNHRPSWLTSPEPEVVEEPLVAANAVSSPPFPPGIHITGPMPIVAAPDAYNSHPADSQLPNGESNQRPEGEPRVPHTPVSEQPLGARRRRRQPSVGVTPGDAKTSEPPTVEMRQVTSGRQRADEVRNTLSSFTDGFKNAQSSLNPTYETTSRLPSINDWPEQITNGDSRPTDRAVAVRDDLNSFTAGMKRGRDEATNPTIDQEREMPPAGAASSESDKTSGPLDMDLPASPFVRREQSRGSDES